MRIHPSFQVTERRSILTELNSDHPVRVTAQERAHPAIRKLARACIALALAHLAGEDSSAQSASSVEQTTEEGTTASGQEQHHA
jgi:hypothetical protein